MAKNWIKKATSNPGGLHRHLHVAENKKIPVRMIEAAAKRPGVVGQEARLALTLEKMHHKKG